MRTWPLVLGVRWSPWQRQQAALAALARAVERSQAQAQHPAGGGR